MNNSVWHTENPTQNGRYLCTISLTPSIRYLSIYTWATSLKSVDEYMFADSDRPGWYNYDSEYGNYEVHDIIAWTELPEPYNGGE